MKISNYEKMLNKLFLLLFTTYVTTTFLNYFPLTKLQIHHIGQESKIDSFWMEMVVRRARLAKIRNDCTNQSITEKQIQVWIKRRVLFYFFLAGGGGWKRTAKWEKRQEVSYKVKDSWILSLPLQLKSTITFHQTYERIFVNLSTKIIRIIIMWLRKILF